VALKASFVCYTSMTKVRSPPDANFFLNYFNFWLIQ